MHCLKLYVSISDGDHYCAARILPLADVREGEEFRLGVFSSSRQRRYRLREFLAALRRTLGHC